MTTITRLAITQAQAEALGSLLTEYGGSWEFWTERSRLYAKSVDDDVLYGIDTEGDIQGALPEPSGITVNEDDQLYVIPEGGGYTCQGFDNALDELERVTLELIGHGHMTHQYQEQLMRDARARRGELGVYTQLVMHRDELRDHLRANSERAVYNLTPQLNGLEGWEVEVQDTPTSTPRRFRVGRSTGWAPCHLEMDPADTGGDPARRSYHAVREIRKVW
jgi:hypothetical protein